MSVCVCARGNQQTLKLACNEMSSCGTRYPRCDSGNGTGRVWSMSDVSEVVRCGLRGE